jgi:electron transport complex protein RnfG
MIGYVKQGWLVLLLAVLFGGALAGVQAALSGRIEQNKKNETYSQVPNLVPGAARDGTKKADLPEVDALEAINADGERIGWVVRGRGAGFADTIELLVGLNLDASVITGVYVLDQKETPGLGCAIATPDFLSNFTDVPARTLQVVKTKKTQPTDIQALSGATVSSDAVTKIVNQTVQQFKTALRSAPAGKEGL